MTRPPTHGKRLFRREIEGFSLDMVRAYCDAIGDDNAIHHDADAARAHGFRGVVVPGMALGALFAECVAGCEPHGHVGDFQIRFLNPLYLDAPFFLEGHVVRESGDGTEAVWRIKARDASHVLAIGEAQLRRSNAPTLPNCEM